MGESQRDGLKLNFDGRVRLQFQGARMVRHARRIVFQMAEVALSRELLAARLKRIDRLRLASG